MLERRVEILFIEDDPDLPELLKSHMEASSYRVSIAADGPTGLTMARNNSYDALIVDYNLPGLTGVEIIKRLREEGKQVPILMLTSRSDEIDKVLSLNAGADDYVTKPFALAELLARINALIRRSSIKQNNDTSTAQRLVFGSLVIEAEMRRVLLDGKEVDLTPLEFDLLLFLACSAGRPFDRGQILENVWGTTVQEYEYSLTSVVARLRKKIELDPANPRYILTMRGLGYRFARPDEV